MSRPTNKEIQEASSLAREISATMLALMIVTRPATFHQTDVGRDKRIRAEVLKLTDETKRRISRLVLLFQRNEISLEQFRAQMRTLVRSSHILSAVIGAGGIANVTDEDWSRLTAKTNEELGYLEGFVGKIRRGAIAVASIPRRAVSYSAGIITSFYASVLYGRPQLQVKRERHASESCPDCIRWEERGWMPAGEMAPIGSLMCGNFCRCELIFSDEVK